MLYLWPDVFQKLEQPHAVRLQPPITKRKKAHHVYTEQEITEKRKTERRGKIGNWSCSDLHKGIGHSQPPPYCTNR